VTASVFKSDCWPDSPTSTGAPKGTHMASVPNNLSTFEET
jgi:hypothetical protein